METSDDINLAEFFSVCIFLAEEAGRTIRNVYQSGKLKTEFKEVDDPVTIADFTVQKTIEHNIK